MCCLKCFVHHKASSYHFEAFLLFRESLITFRCDARSRWRELSMTRALDSVDESRAFFWFRDEWNIRHKKKQKRSLISIELIVDILIIIIVIIIIVIFITFLKKHRNHIFFFFSVFEIFFRLRFRFVITVFLIVLFF